MSDPVQDLMRGLNADLVQRLGQIEPAAQGNLADEARIAGAVDRILSRAAQDARSIRRDAVMKLLRADHKPGEIARAVGLSGSTVKKWKEALELQRKSE